MAADIRPSPGQLWAEAGGDGIRYRALLREHGHLVPLKPGEKAEPLPCGWPGNRRTAERAAGEAMLVKLTDAEAAYTADLAVANGDPDLIGVADRTFEAAIAAAEREVDEVLAAINHTNPTEETR